MIKIFSKSLLRDVGVYGPDDQVTGGANTDFVGNMAGKNELPVVPNEFELSCTYQSKDVRSSGGFLTLFP